MICTIQNEICINKILVLYVNECNLMKSNVIKIHNGLLFIFMISDMILKCQTDKSSSIKHRGGKNNIFACHAVDRSDQLCGKDCPGSKNNIVPESVQPNIMLFLSTLDKLSKLLGETPLAVARFST